MEDLPQLHAIIGTKSHKIQKLRIKIEPNINPLKEKERELLNEIAKIRHMKLKELEIDIEICEIEDRHVTMIGDALEKNNELKRLYVNFWK